MTEHHENLVSVIMPSYNSAEFIAESIDSVIAQSYQDWELLICDDVSTDNSRDIIREYAARDKRIKLIELSENSGAAVARNTSIQASKGRFIAFLDSDDLWREDKLEKQTVFMKQHNVVLSYTYYSVIDEQGQDTGKVMMPAGRLTYKDLLKSNQIGCLTAIYDAGKIGKVEMPLIRKRQDFALWLRILKKGHLAVCLHENLALYRNRTNSISSNKFDLVKYNWRLYRQVEAFSIFKSAYYLAWNIYRKIKS